jgi:lipoyl(octanoyl) transferase
MEKRYIFDMKELLYCSPGLVDYKEAWDLQKMVFELRYQGKIPDLLFLLEHPHTYTLGKTADKNHLVGSQNYLNENKISVYDIDRGGDITYHGPGQIVGYPIINLNDWHKDTHKYLRALEEVIIKTLAFYGIRAERNEKYTGVWIGEKKIAAIGIKVSRWITMHGFAFNINTDLALFNGIIPCGIGDKDVTSLQSESGESKDMNEVQEKVLENFINEFGYDGIKKVSVDEIGLNQFQSV